MCPLPSLKGISSFAIPIPTHLFRNNIISFGYVDFYDKIFLILYTPFENSTTRIAILHKLQFVFFLLFSFIFLKRFLTWWYHRKIRRNEIAMEKLKKQKAKLLDDVMETETYKVAKELLDDFATDAEKRQLNVRLF